MPHSFRIFQKLVAVACLVCVASAAWGQDVRIAPGVSPGSITDEFRYWGVVEPNLSTALAAYRAGAFSEDLAPVSVNPAYAPETWAAVELVNSAPGDGRDGDSFVLTFDAPLMSGFRVFLLRGSGLTENLLDYSAFAPFEPLEHAVTRLRTPEFELAPGERVTVLMQAQMGPFPSFRAGLHTPEDLTEASFRWGVGYTAFYAFALSCLIFFFGFQFAMGSWIGAFYSTLFLAFLGVIALVDGLLFRVAYPQRPDLQSIVGFGLLFGISGMGFLIAGASLRAAQGGVTRLSAAISAMSLVSIAGFALALWAPGPAAAQLAIALLVVMLAAILPGLWVARGDRVALTVGGITVTSLAVLGGAAVFITILTGWGASVLEAPNLLRVVFTVLLLATMTMLTANVIALRRRHLAAVQERLRVLEAEAERSRALLEAERNYTRVRDIASLRQRQLATASHDLKQPLTSLRMTFDTLAGDLPPDTRSRLDAAFDYLGSLATGLASEPDDDAPDETLDGTLHDTLDDTLDGDAAPEAERYALSIPLATVHQMFEREAAAKGLAFRIHSSSIPTDIAPIPLLRILTNLVSNALKYTDAGRVVVGVRRGPRARICVIDTGRGMTEAERTQFQQAYTKGETSTGHGLGLSVCFEQARLLGLTLDVTSTPGRGTCFTLWLTR